MKGLIVFAGWDEFYQLECEFKQWCYWHWQIRLTFSRTLDELWHRCRKWIHHEGGVTFQLSFPSPRPDECNIKYLSAFFYDSMSIPWYKCNLQTLFRPPPPIPCPHECDTTSLPSFYCTKTCQGMSFVCVSHLAKLQVGLGEG